MWRYIFLQFTTKLNQEKRWIEESAPVTSDTLREAAKVKAKKS
jgi:hypothetical protein